MSIIEPSYKRTIAFFDGQSLFHAAKAAFGYSYPNYDPKRLAEEICLLNGWSLKEVYFYTGIPKPAYDIKGNRFWTHKFLNMKRLGINTFSRPLRYRNTKKILPDGTIEQIRLPEEKGFDVRIAIDIIRLCLKGSYDVALIFSQDQDLSEVADEIRNISKERERWIKVACAYPESSAYRNRRGRNGTDWIKINKEIYDMCLDNTDYR